MNQLMTFAEWHAYHCERDDDFDRRPDSEKWPIYADYRTNYLRNQERFQHGKDEPA